MLAPAGACSAGRPRAPALSGLLAIAILGFTAAPSSAEPAPSPAVRVVTTGNDSERVKTLTITRRPGAGKRVAISLGPHALPDLERGDRVRVTAELQVTGDCGSPVPRCVGRIYHHTPAVRARLLIARDPRATGGPATLQIGPAKRERCTQRRPQYEHHCVLTLTHAGFEVRPGRLPCPLDACFVNLVADAYHRHARPGERLIVGGLRPNGRIAQDRGRVNAIRYRDATAGDSRVITTRTPTRRRLRPDLRRRVAYSVPVRRLLDSEQLAVSASMRTDVTRLPYAVRTSARLILADSPRATRQSGLVKHVAFGRGEISENNGSNCTRPEGVCTTRKVGVLELRRDAVDRTGRPLRLYVNLVTVLGPKVRRARARDRVVLRRGGIRVVRFPPALND